MEYIELINKILTAEQNAKSLAQDAQKQKESLEASLKQEADALRVSYLNRARQQMEALEQEERERTQKELASLDACQRDALAQVESTVSAHSEQWAEDLFRLVVGGDT